jgi:hypothetical protein
MASEQGYSNQKKKGKAQFKTIHNVGSDSYGTFSISKSLFNLTMGSLDIDSVVDILGNDGQLKYWNLEIIGHNCTAGCVIRITNNDLINFEFEVIEAPDANHVYVLPVSPVKPDGYMCQPMAWVTSKSDFQGNPQISISPAPVKFVLDGATVDVTEDTVTPANNIPLPVKEMGNLDNIDDNVAIGDGAGNLIGSQLSNTNSVRSFAVFDDDGNEFLNQMNNKLMDMGFVDYDNAWSTPLLANQTFTGTAFEVTKYAAINVCVIADVASATNGLKVEFSIDGTTWDHSHSTTYAGGSGSGYIFNAEFKFARVVYINGAINQTSFKLLTIFKVNPVKQSLYTIDQAVNGNMFAELGKNVIIGKTTAGGGGFVDVKVTPSGALTTESTVTGSVSVTNFPATQPVSGSVSVSNFPATQAVTGTFWQATQPVSGSVSVDNFPATQAVTGTFWQATQPVSGSVSVSNFPATQNVAEQTQSGTITNTQKSVGLTAVRATVSGSAPGAARKKLMLKPSKNNTGSVYLGSSSVTTSNGLEIIGPDRLEFTLDSSDYYLISDTAAQVVEIIEVV